MGGGPEIPADLMKRDVNGPEVVKPSDKEKGGKQHKQEDRKQDTDIKAEKERCKITDKHMGKDVRQEGTDELIEGKKKDKSKREGRNEGKEKRKGREEERSKEDKKRKERAMDGGKKGKSEEREREVVIKDKALEEFDGKAEAEDGKKQKVKDKRKDHTKEGKKERQQGDEDKRHKKEKDRYNVEKLKKKLAKLDAKLEKIMAKRKDYFLRLKEVESASAAKSETTDGEPKDPNVERLANDMASMNVSGLIIEDFPEVIIRENHSELSKKHSEGIVYPRIEKNDITGIGY